MPTRFPFVVLPVVVQIVLPCGFAGGHGGIITQPPSVPLVSGAPTRWGALVVGRSRRGEIETNPQAPAHLDADESDQAAAPG